MKKYLFLGLSLCSAVALTSCKSSESAYKKAYEKAKAQEMAATTTAPVDSVNVTPLTPTQTVTVTQVTPVAEDHSDVRTIPGGVTVLSGAGLKAYSVVVGSFSVQETRQNRTGARIVRKFRFMSEDYFSVTVFTPCNYGA